MSEKVKTIDFGTHLFCVQISAARNEPVVIIEDYGYRGQDGGVPREEGRAVLKRPVWAANRRLGPP